MILKRIAQNKHGTFGVLIDNNIPFAVTLELPWKNNKPFVSCIPAGHYTCRRTIRSNGMHTYKVMNVLNRTSILFHCANTIDDLLGCIGIAEEYGELNGKPAVLSSGRGFKEFMEKLNGIDKFKLDIIDCIL